MLFVCFVGICLLGYVACIHFGYHQVSFKPVLFVVGVLLVLISLIELFGFYNYPLWWVLCLNLGIISVIGGVLFLMIYAKRKEKIPFVPDVIFVFGAGLIENRLSLSLKVRLNKAVELSQKFPNALIIVSGGQGKNEWLSEAEAMYNELVRQGVSSSRIIQEDKSTTTQENLVYSMKLIDLRNKKIALVSNQFHVYRCERMTRKLGLNGWGVPAYMHNIGVPAFYIREVFACIKAILKNEL